MCRKCLKFRKNIESKNPEVVRTKNGRIMLLSKFEVWDSKKSKFRKKTPLNEIPLLGLILF